MMAGYARRVVLLAGLALGLAGCSNETLLHGLDERQANEVVSTLLRENIAASKRDAGKLGFEVTVARDDLADAVDTVHREGLPMAKRTYVDDQIGSDSMVSSPQTERARLISAIERRLEESLTQLRGVLSSRVHASYPLNEGGLKRKDAESSHVSVLLVVDQVADESGLVQATQRLLRNSFESLHYDDVSVVVTRASTHRPVRATVRMAGWMDHPLVTLGMILLAGLLGAAALLVLQPGKHAFRWPRWFGKRRDKDD